MMKKFSLLSSCLICLVGALSGCGGSSGIGSSSPAWNIGISQAGNFAPSGTGQYSIGVANNGSAATSGTVTVNDSLPSVFNANGISGAGWTCTLSTVSCTRSDALATGASYPAITLNVRVAASASGTMTNQATVSGGGAANATASIQTQIGVGGNGKIQHVVIIFQENRTPDNLFQGLCTASGSPGCGTERNQYNIQNYGYVGTSQVPLTPVSLVTNYDQDHGHDAFLSDCDWNGTECAMDGWNANQCSPPDNCPSNPQLQYVEPSVTGVYSLQPYLTMAQTYAFGDNMFQTNQGPSFPAHQYILSGTSAVCKPGGSCPESKSGPTSSTFYIQDNPADNLRADGTPGVGCLAPPQSAVKLIDTSQPFPNDSSVELDGQECLEHPTLTDLLDNAGLTWKYYAPTDGSIWTAPDVISHMCVPYSQDGQYDDTVCSGSDWPPPGSYDTDTNTNVVIEGTKGFILTDIQNGNLASVTWVIPDGGNSDHAEINNGGGPDWVANIVNAIGQSAFWSNTAIIVTWDDWGGWYDHVSPPIRNNPGSYPNSYEYGFRVPIIVISPYAKPQYISHQQNDFGSILLFIEEQFGLGQIDPAVGYADSYASGDLSDFFDFSQTPLTFTPIQADHDAQFFINSKAKPTPPDND